MTVPLRYRTLHAAIQVLFVAALVVAAMWGLRLLQAMTAWPY